MPWVVAFLFGLLHGLGFAGALNEIGLPQHAVPLALAFFNIGVELGQLLFIAAVFVAITAVSLWYRPTAGRPDSWRMASGFSVSAAYVIGTLAMFWLFERTYWFFA